jgi:type IX secretion system PorP/SprF family membrane protein
LQYGGKKNVTDNLRVAEKRNGSMIERIEEIERIEDCGFIKYFRMRNLMLLLSVFLLAVAGDITAQQLSSTQLFHLNQYLQSPAAAGTKPYIFTSAAYTQNWSGIRGAPNMQSVCAHSLVSERVGVGGKIFYENSGLSGQFGAEATYAYHLPLGKNGTRLSLGISAMVSQYSLYKNEFIVAAPDDEAIDNSENSIIVPDAAFGFSLYKTNNSI